MASWFSIKASIFRSAYLFRFILIDFILIYRESMETTRATIGFW